MSKIQERIFKIENDLYELRKIHGTFCVRMACENFLNGKITEIKHDAVHVEGGK